MLARLLAVLAALGMVFGAFVYRYGMPGDGGGGPGGSSGSGDGQATIYCAAELGAEVCDRVDGDGADVVVEAAGATHDRLVAPRTAADARVAGWLAPGPWPAMVDDERARTSRARLFASKGRGLAVTPLVAVARTGQVVPGCDPAAMTWRCIGDAAQGGEVRIGADPPQTSSRLFLRAAALSGFFGSADWAINDLDEQPESRSWLASLDQRFQQAAGFGAPTLDRFVLLPGADVFLTTGATARRVPPSGFDVREPDPAVTVAVTYTAAASGGREIDDEPVREALEAAGWTLQPNATNQGLPSPGVLLALREGA